MAVALWVNKEIEVKKGKRGEKNDPQWKRRIDITNVRRDITSRKRKEAEKLGGRGGAKRNIKELHAENIVKKKN